MKCDSLNIYIFDSSSTLPIMFGVRFHTFRIPSHTPKTHCIQFLCASFRFAISMCNVNIALFDAFGIAILFITPRLLAGVSLSCCFACYVHMRYYYIRARSFFFFCCARCMPMHCTAAHRCTSCVCTVAIGWKFHSFPFRFVLCLLLHLLHISIALDICTNARRVLAFIYMAYTCINRTAHTYNKQPAK